MENQPYYMLDNETAIVGKGNKISSKVNGREYTVLCVKGGDAALWDDVYGMSVTSNAHNYNINGVAVFRFTEMERSNVSR